MPNWHKEDILIGIHSPERKLCVVISSKRRQDAMVGGKINVHNFTGYSPENCGFNNTAANSAARR